MYHPIPRSENEVEEAEFELDHLAASEALPAKDALGKRKAAVRWELRDMTEDILVNKGVRQSGW